MTPLPYKCSVHVISCCESSSFEFILYGKVIHIHVSKQLKLTSKLSRDMDIEQQYAVQVRTRFHVLRVDRAAVKYEHCIHANREAAAILITTKKKRPKRKQFSADTRVGFLRK